MKRIAIGLVFIVGLFFLLFFLGGSFIAQKVVDKGLVELKFQLGKNGVDVDTLQYSGLTMRTPFALSLNQVYCVAGIESGNRLSDKALRSTFQCDQVKLRLRYLPKPAVRVVFKDFDLLIPKGSLSRKNPFERFEKGQWDMNEYLPLSDAKSQYKTVMKKLKALFQDNEVKAKFDFTGTTVLRLEGKETTARLYTHHKDGIASLKFNTEDVRKAADIFEVVLSEEEIGVICDYPLNTFKVLEITYNAKKKSARERRRKKDKLEDPYRHVYWSYTLTREFGPEFAKMVTDAHETLPGNTPQERKMDFLNNEFGRKLAEKGEMDDRELFEIVRTDPGVLRYPSEVTL